MRILVACPTSPKVQIVANKCAKELNITIASELELDLVITLFESEGSESTSAVVRKQMFKRYGRLELDVESPKKLLDEAKYICDLLKAVVRIGLAGLVGEPVLDRLEAEASFELKFVKPKKKGGIVVFSFFEKEGGLSRAEGLSLLGKWISNDSSAFMDGDPEMAPGAFHIYISTRKLSFVNRLCSFARASFSENSVLILDTDETIACEW